MSAEETNGITKEAPVKAAGEDGEWKPSPIEVTHPEHVDPKAIRLFRSPPGG